MHDILSPKVIDPHHDYTTCSDTLIAFLRPFADAELLEMEMVRSFLKDVCLWLNTANDVNMAPPTGDEDYSN